MNPRQRAESKMASLQARIEEAQAHYDAAQDAEDHTAAVHIGQRLGRLRLELGEWRGWMRQNAHSGPPRS